ncbi:rifin PIR protein,putative [Plasmodium sp. DRC-Itaito]|nr:rifin PIR protein,putative [Plasmodium sp. DRC-Itaito]
MKVHYINILLFALPLNILANTHKKPHTTPFHTPKMPTTRSLGECELYAPANYDNDPQMKEVMENFNKQTQQRFHEYEDRMVEKRKQCKDRCDKESQKIVLKDKLEKELMDKFATLDTDIQNDAIPTCVCEKSVEEKVEKGCLRCGGVLGGGVAPSVGLLGGLGTCVWKPKALEATIAAALKAHDAMISAEAVKAGEAMGVKTVMAELEKLGVLKLCPEISESIGSSIPYTNAAKIANVINMKYSTSCHLGASGTTSICRDFRMDFGLIDRISGLPIAPPPDDEFISKMINELVEVAEEAAEAKYAATEAIKEAAVERIQRGFIEGLSYDWYATVGYSVLAIIIIVLIMVIIYLILRRRRKKKMKKKLQYIKLLEE